MKKIFTLFLACVLTSVIYAKEITFDFAANEFNLPTTTNTSDSKDAFKDLITKDGITMTFRTGTGQLSPLMYYSSYNGTIDLRCYAGNNFTISCITGETIKSIDFVNSGKLNVAGDPEGEWGGTNYSTWIGSAATVNFSVGGSTQVTKIIVTTSSEVSVSAPTFSQANSALYSAENIELSTATADANIYYTLDGSVPTTGSTKYTTPINVAQPTTINAIAELNGTLSGVSTISYTFPMCHAVTSVKELEGLTTEDPIRMDAEMVVTYQNGKYLFLRDGNKDALQVYGALDYEYTNGDVMPVHFTGTKNDYNGTLQILPIAYTFKEATNKGNATPIEVSVANAKNYVNNYIVGKNWNLVITKSGNNNVYTLSDESGNSLGVFERFKNITMPTQDGKYNVEGIVNLFNGAYQLYPILFSDPSSVESIEGNNVAVIGGKGEVIVNTSNKAVVEIFAITGSRLYKELLNGDAEHVMLPAGVYIVRVNSVSQKVIVK